MMLKRFISIVAIAVLVAAELTMPAKAAAQYDQQFYAANDVLFFDPTCPSNVAVGSMQLAGDGTIEKILNFFMRKGLNLAQAAGIVGNMAQESGGSIDQKSGIKTPNPAVRQGGKIVDDTYTPENGVGFGLVQWTFTGRQKPLQDHMKQLGVGITDLSGQLEFVWKEMEGSYSHTLRALRAADNPVDAAIAVHGPPNPGYEASADSPAAVRAVRGGNAQKVFDTYKDASALAGSTANSEMNRSVADGDPTKADKAATQKQPSSSSSCKTAPGNGDLTETAKSYAWDKFKGNDIVPRQEYKAAVDKHLAEGRYVGGISHKGIDCGGFVTILLRDSKFETKYNSNEGNTIHQEAWMKDNWTRLTPEEEKDAGKRKQGDVAINETHTYIYVGEEPGFETHIASASLDERAPMSGKEGVVDSSFRWYRQKTGAL